MKLLVTGGAGFIGSHLCERLLADGHEVVCFDNFCDYYDPAIKEANLEHALANERFTLVRGDLRRSEDLAALFAGHCFDVVVHLAAMAGVRPSIEDPALYYAVNVTGTMNLLEACRTHETERFVFASSSSVYGNNRKVPFAEDDNVDFPISPYAATKKACELMCNAWHHLHGISMAVLRFFTVYGPRQRPDLAIHKFARLMLNGEEIPVYGDGSTRRDYTYVDDILQGITAAIDYVREGHRYEIFNLGESQTISLSQMIATLEKTLGVEAKLRRLPTQPGDVEQTFADISKSRRALDYNPQTRFDEGVGKFVNWLRNRHV
ncbi:MAG: SDR family NAD(P)-dependent oxidoreductase [Candidatus Cloacimonetes bacterium]|nr:SDR family NAD(P)-dependent oxidoreductase [Candidatus Cloacimonadota bacterium]